MKTALLRYLVGALVSIMIITNLPLHAYALTQKEQEDTYRVESFWLNGEHPKVKRVLDSDRYLYHLDVTQGGFIKDASYGALSLDPLKKKELYTDTLIRLMKMFQDEVHATSQQEAAREAQTEFFDTLEKYVVNNVSGGYSATKTVYDAVNLEAERLLKSNFTANADVGQMYYAEIYNAIYSHIDDPAILADAKKTFENYKKSNTWLKNTQKFSIALDLAKLGVDLNQDCLDVIVEVRAYEKTNEKFAELLAQIASNTEDSSLKAACNEMRDKLASGYRENFINGIVDKFGNTIVGSIGFSVVKDVLSECNVFAKAAILGIDAGIMVSDWIYNTEDIKKYMRSVYVINVLSEEVVKILNDEFAAIKRCESPSAEYAGRAADIIYHMNFLITLRMLGERSYYKLKDSAYGASIVKALDLFKLIDTSGDIKTIKSWYTNTIIGLVETKTYLNSEIPLASYYVPDRTSDFDSLYKESGKDDAASGGSSESGSSGTPYTKYKGSDFSTNADIAKKIDSVFQKYTPGKSFFTKNGKACNCHANYSFSCVDSPKKCNCLRYTTINGKSVDLKATQCWGYAVYWERMLFGCDEKNNTSKFKKLSGVSGSLTADKTKNWFVQNKDVLHPGTHIRVFNSKHSIVLLDVNYEKGTVTYVQCNWVNQNTNQGLWCKVSDVTTQSWQKFASTFSTINYAFVLKNYHTKFPEINTLTVNYHANGGSIATPVFVGDEYKVTSSIGLNVRSGPGTSYSRLGGYANTEKFTVVEYRKDSTYTWGWGRVNYNGKDGWIALDSDWVTKTGTVYSPDFYLSSSKIFKKSTNAIAQRTMTAGDKNAKGLHDAADFGLYRDGFKFLGWSLSQSGGDIILPGKAFAPESIVPELSNGDKTVTVYAVWEVDIPVVMDKTVESIAISSIPAKPIYYVGESTYQSGISIIAKHTDGSYSKVTEGFTCSPSTFTSEGPQTVTVNYSGSTATYTVQVTRAKAQVNNATAKVNSVGHHAPSQSSSMFPSGAYAKDKIQVLCQNGDFYLCLIPWGATTTTIDCGALMYLDVKDVTLSAEIPSASEFFTMNPTQTNNAVANTATKLYWKATLKAITYNGKEVAPQSIPAGAAVKVLFEMNGNYCVESGGYIGFANKAHFTLNSTARGVQSSKSEIDAVYGETILAEDLTVQKIMSDGTATDSTDYSVEFPAIDSVGTQYALIEIDGFVDFIKVNVTKPTIQVINIPQKSAYHIGEPFDTTGLKVVAIGANGNQTDITSQIDLAYDFSEAGHKSVTISYAGAKTYLPVLVYSKPIIEVDTNVMGYQGETVTLPVYYHNTCEYTFPMSFVMELSYDPAQLEYVSAQIPSLTQDGQMIIDASVPGKLVIAYTDQSAINDGDILQNITFTIKSLDTPYEDFAAVAITQLKLFDSAGRDFDAEITDGHIHTAGKYPISYYSDGTLVYTDYAAYKEAAAIIEEVPSKDGYIFLGWSTGSDNSIPEYKVNDTFVCDGEVSLHAVYRVIVYTVSYDANGGSGTMVGDMVTQNGLFTLASCTFEAPYGCRFKAWAIGSADGEQKAPGEMISVTEETAVFAIWEEIPHSCVGELQVGQDATCVSDGWHDYYQCPCGKLYAEEACINEITDLAAWKADAGSITASHDYGTLIPAIDQVHTQTELVAGIAAHYHCAACGQYFTEYLEETTLQKLIGITPSHSYGDWMHDADMHWRECDCGDRAEITAHFGGDATCQTRAMCVDCGVEYGELADHFYSEATCTQRASCLVCGDETGDLANHCFIDGVCECGEVDPDYQPPHEHCFIDGVCECGEVDPDYQPPHEHCFIDGVCECGEVDPDYRPPHEHCFIDGVCECGEVDPDYVLESEVLDTDKYEIYKTEVFKQLGCYSGITGAFTGFIALTILSSLCIMWKKRDDE